MKIIKKPATSKLAARFDNELRDIIMNDLRSIKEGAKIVFLKAIPQPTELSVA
jgi:hypothetical protein